VLCFPTGFFQRNFFVSDSKPELEPVKEPEKQVKPTPKSKPELVKEPEKEEPKPKLEPVKEPEKQEEIDVEDAQNDDSSEFIPTATKSAPANDTPNKAELADVKKTPAAGSKDDKAMVSKADSSEVGSQSALVENSNISKEGYSPGKYVTTDGVAITKSGDKTSKKVGNLDTEQTVQITEICNIPGQDRIRGKMNRGWITLKDTSSNRTWVRKITESKLPSNQSEARRTSTTDYFNVVKKTAVSTASDAGGARKPPKSEAAKAVRKSFKGFELPSF